MYFCGFCCRNKVRNYEKYNFQKREQRRKKKLERITEKIASIRKHNKLVNPLLELVLKGINTPMEAADIEFERRFIQNRFGIVCGICDRLWFEFNMKNIPRKAFDLVTAKYPEANLFTTLVCDTCYQSLLKLRMPRLATVHGFFYPPRPENLPKLDPISARLISPRLLLMQIRRLRYLNGSKSVIGQVINIPVDVNSMVTSLPRCLDDDHAFNIHIKRHMIHKTSILSGYIKKSIVKAWLTYLITTPLYRMYNIRIDKEFLEKVDVPFTNISSPDNRDFQMGDTSEEPLIEEMSENVNEDVDLRIAKQQTLMWSEEHYLDIAPGMNKTPLSLVYDKHAEELGHPDIYYGHPRVYTIDRVTPYMKSTSEIRRSDRRGAGQEHILFMTMNVMRLRLTDGMYCTFKDSANLRTLTREDLENKDLIESMIEKNLSFLKSIPNSVQYWMSRKKDLFAMLRQLGKPTFFLTLSASEHTWSDLLCLLYRLKERKEWTSDEDPVVSMGPDLRTTLVNEDPVTCCLYFDKLVDTIMYLLKHCHFSPFHPYRVLDYFKRIEFQQRGSPHAHILLWLDSDPRENISEDMPETIKLINTLITVTPTNESQKKLQCHKHTFTCYKNNKDGHKKICRFGAPFWPIKKTTILLPLTEEGDRNKLKTKYTEMHKSLEFEDFVSLEHFLRHHGVNDYATYLNILRAGIKRPKAFIERKIEHRWVNNFNPWISKILRSNCDGQYVVDEFSCASYVVEYVNKTNRGISDLQRELINLRDEYPDEDYSSLLTAVGLKMLNAVEISSQEGAWYLLNLHMSEASRKVVYVPTTWPHERQRVRKSKKQLDEDNEKNTSINIWKETAIEKYETRPESMNEVTLAQFSANYYKARNSNAYKLRNHKRVLRYRNYDTSDFDEYMREMVLLYVPFRSEENDLLENNKYRSIYEDNEKFIMEARKEFEYNIDVEKLMEECRRLCIEEDEDDPDSNERQEEFLRSREIDEDFVENLQYNDDIILQIYEKMSAVVRKRENVMTSQQYCEVMRQTNAEQRILVLEVIHRIFQDYREPLQIFLTGPAGSGKTFTIKILMETYNRCSQLQNNLYNAYVACGSTGVAASAIGGSTVHSAFRLRNSYTETKLSVEAVNSFRVVFAHIHAIFLEECSMIGSAIFNQVHKRLQQIFHRPDCPFGNIDMICVGDLNQLAAVRQVQIYKRSKLSFVQDIIWQKLSYYPLHRVMRQADETFSSILTKVGFGKALQPEEKCLLESRFRSYDFVNENLPGAIRLFFNTIDVHNYNLSCINGPNVIYHTAIDEYDGHKTEAQLHSARGKVHKLKPDNTGGMPYVIHLQIGKPYMIRTNINVVDGLVNGAIGILRYIEHELDSNNIKRLWFSFGNDKIGRLKKLKSKSLYISNPDINPSWVPLKKNVAKIKTSSRLITCKRTQFPIVEACAITVHKAQGSTYDVIVYDYKKSHDQQLVYVALSRVTSIDGLFLTNVDSDFTFYHYRERENPDLQKEYKRLQNHQLVTITDTCREFLTHSTSFTLCTFNVQSLTSHWIDVNIDSIFPLCRIMSLCETWINNADQIPQMNNFRVISHFKRQNNRSAGVIILENMSFSNDLQSSNFELLKFDSRSNNFTKQKLLNDDIGDICSIRTKINGIQTFIVAVYISPNATLEQLCEFFLIYLHTFNLQKKYSPINMNNLMLTNHTDIPLIVSGDFNLDFRSEKGERFLKFMQTTFNLIMNNDKNISTTRSYTCIDAVFSRHVIGFETQSYISYFSMHRPLLSATRIKCINPM